jgi:phosphatidylserine decarboxylase
MKMRLAQGTPWFVGALWIVPVLVRRPWARALSAAFASGTTWFFRDPERAPDGDGYLAAADGVVQWVRTDDRGRASLSTYLNLLDVHVTRAPCDATVVAQTYRRGRHRRASSPEAHVNERMEWRLSTEHGEVLLTQYAGAVARRIVAYRSTGDVLRRGEPIGLIRFGSRVDVTLPEGLGLAVSTGQRVHGGATVVARLGPA